MQSSPDIDSVMESDTTSANGGVRVINATRRYKVEQLQTEYQRVRSAANRFMGFYLAGGIVTLVAVAAVGLLARDAIAQFDQHWRALILLSPTPGLLLVHLLAMKRAKGYDQQLASIAADRDELLTSAPIAAAYGTFVGAAHPQ